jgi:acetylornithine deacetylase/succinyl-diaminopimelate desuccinylase-like protein
VGGERDSQGNPFCYGGSKGLLRVRLMARGGAHPLPAGVAASVPNPVWRLTWALNHIKGEDEDIRVNGFYDTISGPGKGERETLRKVKLDEAGRRESWQIPAFLFEMSGAALVRSEVTLPTCNISSFSVDPPGDMQCVPVSASAVVDFQLVPEQGPDAILALLKKHLTERGCDDIMLEELPGSYAPVRISLEDSLIQSLIAAGERVYGEPLATLPLGTFVQPLHTFHTALDMPVAALALARHDSAVRGPNERLPLDDLLQHSAVLTQLLMSYRAQSDKVEVVP